MAERKRSIKNVITFPEDHRAAPIRRLLPHRLREARQAKRMTQASLADIIGVTRQAVSAYEAADKSPDSDTFRRLVDALGQPPAFFTTDNLSVFGEQKPQFFRKCGPKTLRKNMACKILGQWVVQIVKYYDGYVNFPAVRLLDATPQNQTESYSMEEIENIAEACRKRWGLGNGPITNVLALFEGNGIAVCRYEMENDNIDAFSFWNGDRPFIFMASDKESVARHRYDLGHELGHLVLHRWIEAEELEVPEILKRIEAEANTFAGAFLLPRHSFPNEVYTARLDAFIELKQRWGVSIQSMIYRCRDLGVIDEDQFTNLYKQLSARKWIKKEPLDDPDIMPLEEPKLLRRAVEVILKGKRRHPDEILSDLNFDATLIEDFCNLSRGMFDRKPYEIAELTLKSV
jgi:Zn-dependent peptidase ImmA (M78 family)/transcriptional regulator with XRE-family HTH domain